MSEQNNLEHRFPTRLESVFHQLRKGKHLCVDDGQDFRDLQKNENEYSAIFRSLGYTLVRNPQNFYYFSGGNQLNSKGVRRVTLFVLILYQYLEDRKFDKSGKEWLSTLTDRTFQIDELPHFSTSALRSLMLSLDIRADNLRDKVLQVMKRLGVIEFSGTNAFLFRAPVYRFIDLCVQYSQRELPDDAKKESSSELPDEEIWEDVEMDTDDKFSEEEE